MIGIFDSGIGGLSVLAKIREKAPNADIIYFGDTANAPYGTRPLSELKVLTESAVEFLLSQGARDIVSACNSVSAFMTLSESGFLAQVPLSIIEMTRPTIRALARDFTGEKIVFLATPATIASSIYARGCAESGINATHIAIPELAGAIERGAPRDEIISIVARAVSVLPRDTDVVSLSCTHYPFVQDIFIEEIARAGLAAETFDPADSVAEEVCVGCEKNGNGTARFILSKDSAVFRDTLSRIFVGSPMIEIRDVSV
ncbi:MAG: hypothetical protein AAB769_00255 [Patescibacteria group bacterium]